MVQQEPRNSNKKRIIEEIFSSETISMVGDLLTGTLLSLLILPFKSFISLILIIPALLSLRGNISGPFKARTARDLIIGDFNRKNCLENVLATFSLSLLTSLLIGIVSIFLNLLLIKTILLTINQFILIPIICMLISFSASIPCSILLNFITFKKGLDPNNVVLPIMTAIDDFFTIISFYLTLLLLGVP